MKRSPLQLGFTIIDVLVALACIAVLTTLAWPSYQGLMLRSQRAHARTALLQTAHWLERAASANGTYPASNEVPTSVMQIEGQRYQMRMTGSAQSYSLSATPVGTQMADSCGMLTLDHLGVRGVQGGSQSAASCWSR